MQQRDKRCYLCMLLDDDYSEKNHLEEHHAIFGTAQRRLSERYGLKVYLCKRHHVDSPDAVHVNAENAAIVKDRAQRAFESHFPHLDFRSIFGKNYKLEEECENKERRAEIDGFIKIEGEKNE